MVTYHRLTQGERYQILALKRSGLSIREMARNLRRAPSTISRELRRHGRKSYSPVGAHRRAQARRAGLHPPRRITAPLARKIDALLKVQWSPEQVSGRLKLKGVRISHETIYQYIYRRRRDGDALYLNLRRRRKARRSRKATRAWKNNGKRLNLPPIDERPKIVERRKRLGDYERDTLLGGKDCDMLLTIVDRTSRLTKLARMHSQCAEEVHCQTRRLLKGMPLQTITNDNGKEFSSYKKTAKALGIPIYFSHPYCSWQRGTNENTNGLIRQYFPKGTDFTKVSDQEIAGIERLLNNRPRKCLGFKTPSEVQEKLNSEVLR